jgi:hypothetical protein
MHGKGIVWHWRCDQGGFHHGGRRCLLWLVRLPHEAKLQRQFDLDCGGQPAFESKLLGKVMIPTRRDGDSPAALANPAVDSQIE